MNVAFHQLVGIALAHETAAHAPATDRARRLPWLVACLLAVGSHLVLDGLPHYYPLTSWEDTVTSLVLVSGWCLLIRPDLRKPLLLVCLAALLPDIVDHVPDDLRKHTGLPVPALPNLFPCHWPAGSGSWRGRSGPDWVVSLVNHLVVVAFCAASLFRTRHLLRPPWGRGGPPRA